MEAAESRAMGKLRKQDRREAPPATLGEVLYADESKTHALERDWVALVASIAAGDQFALQALYERAHRPVFTLAMRIAGNPQTAEEITLDVFHDVWRRAPRYDAANGSVLGWIMNQARSRAIDRLRFDQRQKRGGVQSGQAESMLDTSELDDEQMLRQRGESLRQALTVLTPDERQAIEAAFFSGLTYAEVAAQVQQPLGTVKTRIRTALQKLRRALAEESRTL